MQTLILAGGASTRMGRDKAILPWGDQTVIEHLVSLLGPISERTMVITGNNHAMVSAMLFSKYRLDVVHNIHWEQGMLSSIRCGFEKIGVNSPVLLQMVDQPHLPTAFYEFLLSCWRPELMAVQPVACKDGRLWGGHPLLLSPRLRGEFSLPGMNTLRDVLSRHAGEILKVETNNMKILEDMDTDEDYQRLWREYSAT